MKALNTPYADVLLPLSAEELAALELSIKADGVLVPVLHTEDGRVLDGHHRLKIDPNAPRKAVPGSRGWTDAECIAYVIRTNWERRNLSPDQKAELRQKQKAVALELREQDPKRFTLGAVAKLLGVHLDTVSGWLTPNSESRNGSKPDARVKVKRAAKKKAAARVAAGETQAQVASDLGVTQQHVSRMVAEVKKEEEEEAERQERVAALAELEVDGFRLGDFREVAKSIPDGALDLIFTDPPYDRKSLPLYGDLAQIARDKLAEGGSLICYLGQYQIHRVLELVTPHLRLWWTLAVVHTGKFARMTEYGVVVRWKPLLWFVKGTRADKHTFVDDLVMSEQEKDAHDWQQSLEEASYYVGALTPENGLVFDPFCGGGTTALACKFLNLRFITCDTDKDALAIAKGRFADADRATHGGRS